MCRINNRVATMIVTNDGKVVVLQDKRGMRFPSKNLGEKAPTTKVVDEMIAEIGYTANMITDLGTIEVCPGEQLHLYLVRQAHVMGQDI